MEMDPLVNDLLFETSLEVDIPVTEFFKQDYAFSGSLVFDIKCTKAGLTVTFPRTGASATVGPDFFDNTFELKGYFQVDIIPFWEYNSDPNVDHSVNIDDTVVWPKSEWFRVLNKSGSLGRHRCRCAKPGFYK